MSFPGLSFERLVTVTVTMRNWLIGLYISEYEQQGTDRAHYGDKLLDRLSEQLCQAGVSRTEVRELRRYRLFYLTYPQIRESLSPELATQTQRQTILTLREAGNGIRAIGKWSSLAIKQQLVLLLEGLLTS